MNSLQVPFLQAAQTLVVKGVADPETMDKAWRTAWGAPHGPFQALDVIGLTTAYNVDAVSDEESRAASLRDGGDDADRIVAAVAPLAAEYEASPQQIALAWLLHRSPATLPIPGTTSLAHLRENIAAAQIRLTQIEVAELTALVR